MCRGASGCLSTTHLRPGFGRPSEVPGVSNFDAYLADIERKCNGDLSELTVCLDVGHNVFIVVDFDQV